jgi:hypothetical protein
LIPPHLAVKGAGDVYDTRFITREYRVATFREQAR